MTGLARFAMAEFTDTYATELANANISVYTLMKLLDAKPARRYPKPIYGTLR